MFNSELHIGKITSTVLILWLHIVSVVIALRGNPCHSEMVTTVMSSIQIISDLPSVPGWPPRLLQLLVGGRREAPPEELDQVEREAGDGRDDRRLPDEVH